MSYTLFVEGKITETVGGDYNIFSDGNIVFNANGVITHTGEENGVIFGTPLQAPPPPSMPLDAKCIVHFRPKSSWKGEFGFDWFRDGHKDRDDKIDYKNWIGKYYTDSSQTTINTDMNNWYLKDSNKVNHEFFKSDPQTAVGNNKIEQLKTAYGRFNYSIENDEKNEPITKNYFVPIISLFAEDQNVPDYESEVELKLYIEYKDPNKPDKLEFRMDNVVVDDKHPLVSINKATIDKKDISKEITIKLKCKTATNFAQDKQIEVFAIQNNTDGSVLNEKKAGTLKMFAPGKKQTLNVVIVQVTTPNGEGDEKGLKEFERNLRQALIVTNITKFITDSNGKKSRIKNDISSSTFNFNTKFEVKNGSNITKTYCDRTIGDVTEAIDLLEFLDIELEKNYPNTFTNHFKLYFLKNVCKEVQVDTAGNKSYVSGYSVKNTSHGIMFGTHDAATIGHECMHGLGLSHSFYSGAPYTFKAMQTDNIMDYSHLIVDPLETGSDADGNTKTRTAINRFTSWFWQWEILNERVKNNFY